jgi:hypothetical protein
MGRHLETSDCWGQNTGPHKKSRRWVDWVRPLDVTLHLPWVNRHRPYISLHITRWGYEGGPDGWRRVLWVQFMWGCLFADGGGSKVWQPCGKIE